MPRPQTHKEASLKGLLHSPGPTSEEPALCRAHPTHRKNHFRACNASGTSGCAFTRVRLESNYESKTRPSKLFRRASFKGFFDQRRTNVELETNLYRTPVTVRAPHKHTSHRCCSPCERIMKRKFLPLSGKNLLFMKRSVNKKITFTR